jgi:hypothetical protein
VLFLLLPLLLLLWFLPLLSLFLLLLHPHLSLQW